jgi:hypothetical protein
MTITGLRQRLENLEGVAAIQLELAETGLSGIKVTLAEGADEASVLERIRSMLVTYGLRSPGPFAELRSAVTNPHIETVITPEGERMRVEVRGETGDVVRVIDASPLAAAQVVAEGRAVLTGRPRSEVIWIGLDMIGDWRIMTVLARDPTGAPQVGAAVVSAGWADALNRAVARATDAPSD